MLLSSLLYAFHSCVAVTSFAVVGIFSIREHLSAAHTHTITNQNAGFFLFFATDAVDYNTLFCPGFESIRIIVIILYRFNCIEMVCVWLLLDLDLSHQTIETMVFLVGFFLVEIHWRSQIEINVPFMREVEKNPHVSCVT